MSPRPRLPLIACIGLLLALNLNLGAQPTNIPSFGISVTPTNGSVFPSDSTNAVFVTITNWVDVTNVFTNITVKGTFGSQTNIVFRDDGQAPDKTGTNGTFSGNVIAPVTELVPLTQTLLLVIRGEQIVGEPPPDPLPEPQLVTNSIEYVIVPRPWNDRFTNAFKIPQEGGVILATNNYASLEAREPQHARVPSVAASVWWYWSTPLSTNVLIDLGGSSFDPVLAVYTGNTLSNLVLVKAATNDVVNRLKPYVGFNTTAGTTYRIAVAGYNDSTNGVGDIRLRVALGALPDTSGPVASIVSPAGETTVTNAQVALTGTAKERNLNESGVSKVILRVANTTNQVVATGTAQWSAVLTLPVGVNLVQATAIDYDGNFGPPASVVIRYVNPVNDMFANAIELIGVGNSVTVDNTYATKEPGEPLHAGNEGGHSVWYSWRAPVSGDLYLNTEGSSIDTLLGLYIGDSVSNLFTVAFNDDVSSDSRWSALTQPVTAGQLYYIALDGNGGSAGTLNFTYSFYTTVTRFQLSVATPLGGSVQPPSGLYEAGTVLLLSATPDKNFAFVRWEDPSGTFVSVENPVALVMNRNYSLEAKFQVQKYTDTFSSGDLRKLPWTTAGSSPWSVTMLGGRWVARSGLVIDGQSSSLVLVTNTYAGTGAFDCQVSSELGGDWLEFYLNGVRLNRWSGETPWQTYMFPVPAGKTTMEWRYVKDANFSAGRDAAFIGNVYVPLEKPNPPPTGPLLLLTRLPNGSGQLTVQAQPNVSYWIQTSSNLVDWVSVSTNRPSSYTFQWVDPDSFMRSRRFYRVLAPAP
jgi:hypothetical protein